MPVYFFIFRSLSPSISLSVSLSLSLSFPSSLSLPLSVLPLCTSPRLIHLVCQFVAFLSRAPRVSDCFFMYIHLCMKIPLWWKSQQSLQRSRFPWCLSNRYKVVERVGERGADVAKSCSSLKHLLTVGPLPTWMCACIIKRWGRSSWLRRMTQ